jgi:fimbrial isopeptide formation D2 family protein
MTCFKKIEAVFFSLLLSFLPFMLPVKAESTTGSITINNAIVDQTYSIYKILNLDSFDTTTGQFSYSVTSDWKDFFTGSNAGAAYMRADSEGNISLISSISALQLQTLASDALSYANTNGIAATASQKASSTSITFENLDLGYYLLSSSQGTLCSLDTTAPSVVIEEKNKAPVLTFEALEEDVWHASTTATIGQNASYRLCITAEPGAENYVVSLSLPTAMDFGSVSGVTLNGTALLAGTDYSVTNADNTYTFTFSQSFLNTISEESQIILNFSASLNANAVVGGRTGGNISSAWLSYGSSSAAVESDPINVATYTYQVSVVKTNPDNLVLNGAQFSLYEGNTLIYFVDEGNGQYRVADAQDSNTISTFSAGAITLNGLGNGSYSLSETSAPAGYNALSEPYDFTISSASLLATVDTNSDGTKTWVWGGVHVINQSGTEMPETGSTGLLICLIGGICLVIIGLIWRYRLHAAKA